MNRRKFLQSTSLICIPNALVIQDTAANWPTNIFESENYEQALKLQLNNMHALEGSIELIVPSVAENGVKVPIEVKTDLADVKSISIFVINNPKPYVAKFIINPYIASYAGVHIKMRETSEVVALVEASNDYYLVKKNVTVTAGGCA